MRQHLTTNDKIKAILEGAVRDRFDDNVGADATGKRRDEFERGKRMAALYGTNQGSKLVQKRTKARGGRNLTPSLRETRSAQTVPGSSIRGDSLDSFASSLESTSIRNPIDLQMRTCSPYRTETKPTTPWYIGYKNSTQGPPSSSFARASRYGFSGSMSMSQLDRPSTTLAKGAIPGFLGEANSVDEWAPKLQGTPVLWPEDSAHVSGASIKHRNTHWVAGPKHEKTYTKGKTFEKTCEKNPQKFKHLKRAYAREQEESMRLNESVARERRRRYKQMATGSISSMRSSGASLTDNSKGQTDRRLKYWSNFTLVHAEETNATQAREKLEKEKSDRLLRYRLKWKELKTINKILRATRQPNNEDIDAFEELLSKTSTENPDPCCLSRDQFCKIVLGAHGSSPLASLQLCNRLFSSFDPRRRDKLDYREIVGTLRLLRKPGQPAGAKLRDVVQGFDIQKQRVLSLDEAKTIMLMGVSSDEDMELIMQEFIFAFELHIKQSKQSAEPLLMDHKEFLDILDYNDELMAAFDSQLQAITDGL